MSHTPPRPWAAGAESVGVKTCPRLSSGQKQGFCRWLVLFWAPWLFQVVVGEYLDGIPSGEKKKKKSKQAGRHWAIGIPSPASRTKISTVITETRSPGDGG